MLLSAIKIMACFNFMFFFLVAGECRTRKPKLKRWQTMTQEGRLTEKRNKNAWPNMWTKTEIKTRGIEAKNMGSKSSLIYILLHSLC